MKYFTFMDTKQTIENNGLWEKFKIESKKKLLKKNMSEPCNLLVKDETNCSNFVT